MFKKYLILLSSLILFQCSLPEIEDVTPPEVVVAYPYDGAVISASINVRISAADDEEVTEVSAIQSAESDDDDYDADNVPIYIIQGAVGSESLYHVEHFCRRY